MSRNKNLTKAKAAKNDEFYTRREDIRRECFEYRDHFMGKVILCNCDDPAESNFYKYFAANFEFFGLKKLISTHYETDKPSYKLEITADQNEDGKVDGLDTVRTPLEQNGDFRSPECIEILKEADIVVTNGPFSLFREYLAQLMEYEKDFLIIGPMSAMTNVDMFPLIRDGRVWFGKTNPKAFIQPDGSIKKFGNICWYTNLDYTKLHEDLVCSEEYSPDRYPTYNNYNAIEVKPAKDIPKDYPGVMGVPITFLPILNPKQFEIVGITNGRDEFDLWPSKKYTGAIQVNKNGSTCNGSKVNTGADILYSDRPRDDDGNPLTCYTADGVDGFLLKKYARILIKHKNLTE